jgi:hypothetical protein
MAGLERLDTAKTASILTPLAIRNLEDFVLTIGWRVIYGHSLRHGTAENAAAAKYVAATLCSKLPDPQGDSPDAWWRRTGR